MNRTRCRVVACLLLSPVALAQNGKEDVEIVVQPVAEGIYMLKGRGGNIGVSVGEDATFIVGDQYAPLTGKIVAAIASVTDRPVDYVLNTHWHFDHTGGNENLGERGALIMAHDNVHKRMAAGQYMAAFDMQIDPAPAFALPVVTFNDSLPLHANGLTIRGIHMANDDIAIVPGHGPLARRDDLVGYRAMLVGIRDAVAGMIAEGKSLEGIQAAKPTADFDAEFADGFVPPERFVATVYASLGGE